MTVDRLLNVLNKHKDDYPIFYVDKTIGGLFSLIDIDIKQLTT